MQSLEEALKILFKWFLDNLIKSNADKCHSLVSTSNNVNIRIDNFDITNSKFDHKLTFDDNIFELCTTASREIHGLARATPYMNISKWHILMNAFATSQFIYCPLIWIWYSRISNKKRNVHERCLRMIFQDKLSSFEQLWKKDNTAFIHLRNFQFPATEMYKISNGLSPILIKELFMPNNAHTYSLRHLRQFKTPSVSAVYLGTESVSF